MRVPHLLRTMDKFFPVLRLVGRHFSFLWAHVLQPAMHAWQHAASVAGIMMFAFMRAHSVEGIIRFLFLCLCLCWPRHHTHAAGRFCTRMVMTTIADDNCCAQPTIF